MSEVLMCDGDGCNRSSKGYEIMTLEYRKDETEDGYLPDLYRVHFCRKCAGETVISDLKKGPDQ